MIKRYQFLRALAIVVVILNISACSTPEQKAKKYYEKGMALLETDPAKANLEFQNALQLNKNLVQAVYGMALVAEKNSDWQTCFVLINKVLEEDPKHLKATVKLAQMFLAAGNLEHAAEKIKRAAELDPNDNDVMMLQATLDFKNGNSAKAIESANHVLSKDKNNQDAYLLLASEKFSSKDNNGALAIIAKGLAIKNDNLILHLLKIQALEAENNFPEIVKAYNEAKTTFPSNYSINYKLAEFYYKNSKNDLAEAELREIIKIQPSENDPKLKLVQFLSAVKGPQFGRAELEKMVKDNPNNHELMFNLVDLYDNQQDATASDQLLKNIVASEGDKTDGLKAKVIIASKLIAKNRIDDGLNIIKEVLVKDGANQAALFLRAKVLIDTQKYDDATLDLRAILREQPDSSKAHLMLANLYELNGSSALAEESYDKAYQTSKLSLVYGVAYAEFFIRKTEYDRAEKLLTVLLKRNPSNLAVVKALAEAKIFKGDFLGAQALADTLKEANDTNLSNLIEGAVLARKNDFSGAIEKFKKAHQENPNSVQPILAIVRTLLANKNYKDAQSFLESVVVKNQDYDLNLLLSQIYVLTQSTQKSEALLNKMIEQFPKKSQAYEALAASFVRSGDMQKAKEIIQKGLSALPNSFNIQMIQAEAFQIENNYTEATVVYEKALKENPSSLYALNNYVSIVSDFETNKEKMQRAYDMAQKLKGSNVPYYLDTLGWVSYRVGKYDEAILQLGNAIKILPDYAVFHYHLGKVYLDKHDKVKAKESLETAYTLSKNQNATNQSAEIKALLKTI